MLKSSVRMSTTKATHLYAMEAEQDEMGNDDGKLESVEEKYEQLVRSTVNLTFVDDVFEEWRLQCSARCRPQRQLRRKLLRNHHTIPYRSTVFDYDSDDGITISRWRNIKLCNNGFIYSTVPVHPTVPGIPRTISRRHCEQ
jgi:hypothetical protein